MQGDTTDWSPDDHGAIAWVDCERLDGRVVMSRGDELRASGQNGQQIGSALAGVVEAKCLDGEEHRPVDVVGRQGLGADVVGVDGCRCGVRPLVLAHGQHSGDDDRDDQNRNPSECAANPAPGASLPADALPGLTHLGVGESMRRVEEILLRRRQVGAATVPPLERLGQSDASVQLGVRTTHETPGVGRVGQMAEDALPVDVVVEPAPEARPRSGQGLVGQLDDTVVAGQEASIDEQLDQVLVVGVGGERAPGHRMRHGLAVGGGRHQAQQEVAEQRALFGRDPFVDGLGGSGPRRPAYRRWPGSRRR